MNGVAVEAVRSFMLDRLEGPLAAKRLTPRDVPDNFDLLTEGIIDSLGIVELISAVEDQFDIEIDFEDLNAEELTIVGPFCRYIAKKSGDSNGGML
ncbi:MAG: acyl carrier protein [Candidatus Tectomicrobia bacterium]|nr:acyl carrier protein [Candidatus Tectomicrobia bacterium]